MSTAGSRPGPATIYVIGSCQVWAVGGNGELWDKQANKCLNDPAGKSANGTPIVGWTCNDGAAQMIAMYPAATVDGPGRAPSSGSGSATAQ